MADTKISDLAAVTDVLATDEFVMARSGTTKKIDASDLSLGLFTGGGVETLAYVEFTSPVTVSSTTEAGANSVVTSGSITYDGVREVEIEFYTPRVDIGTTGGSFIVITLWDSSTDLGRIAVMAGGSNSLPVKVSRFITPSGAAHEYRIKAWRVNSNGTIGGAAGGATANLPGYIRVTAYSG